MKQFAIISLACLSLFVGCASDKPITQSTEVGEPRTATPPDWTDGLKKRVVVFPFINRSKYLGERLGTYAASLLSDMLIRTRSFVIVEPKDLGMETKDLIVDGRYDRVKVIEVCRAAGVSGVIFGEVDKVEAKRNGDEVGMIKQKSYLMEAEVRTQMYDVRSGKDLVDRRSRGAVEESGIEWFFNESKSQPFDTSKLKRSLYKAFLDVVPRIQRSTSKVDWSGRIAHMKGDRIYLNAGQMTGLQVGDTLKVLDDGEEIFDPVSNQLIGQSPGRVKGTVKVIAYFGKDGSLCVLESGGGFREGDRVELY